MALAKINKKVLAFIVGVLISTSIVSTGLYLKERNSHKDTKEEYIDITKDLVKHIKTLESDNNELSQLVDYKVNSSSTIGSIREDLVKDIQMLVEKRGEENNNPALEITESDAIRALKSAENRIMDEYVRIAALILTTMNTESNFNYSVNSNKNGTKDYGIMQVNEVTVPQLKEVFGKNFDPLNNRSNNVEAGSYYIYECYLKAKQKHPEDVIWWTYNYYNRGEYFESTDAWRDPNHPNHKDVKKQADIRGNKFKGTYEFYYNELLEAVENKF